MTIHEVSKSCCIPIGLLKEYESWNLCGAAETATEPYQYDDQDIRRLSMIMTLHDIGFENREIEKYMRLLLRGGSTCAERMRILTQKRDRMLDTIHAQEKRLERIDFLRHQLRKECP